MNCFPFHQASNDGPCLGWRPAPDAPYSFHCYSVVDTMAKNFITGLTLAGGLERGNTESFLGIYSQNRVEWMVAALGCWMMSNSIVPLYDTLGPEACSFIMTQTEMTSILCDTKERGKMNSQLTQFRLSPALLNGSGFDCFDF